MVVEEAMDYLMVENQKIGARQIVVMMFGCEIY